MRSTSALILALLGACSSNRIADQRAEDVALLCKEHPVSANFRCPVEVSNPCNATIALTTSCSMELAKASDDCAATVDDFIACADAKPCPLTSTPECKALAACGIHLRELIRTGCP